VLLLRQQRDTENKYPICNYVYGENNSLSGSLIDDVFIVIG